MLAPLDFWGLLTIDGAGSTPCLALVQINLPVIRPWLLCCRVVPVDRGAESQCEIFPSRHIGVIALIGSWLNYGDGHRGILGEPICDD